MAQDRYVRRNLTELYLDIQGDISCPYSGIVCSQMVTKQYSEVTELRMYKIYKME